MRAGCIKRGLRQKVFLHKHLRRMVGLPYMIGGKNFPAEEPASQEEVEAHIRKLNLQGLVFVGYVIPMIVLWLMVFKPF